MDFFSKLRRNIITEGSVYNVKDLFEEVEGDAPEIDNPDFYDLETKTLKLGNLCANEINSNTPPTIDINGRKYTTYCALSQLSHSLTKSMSDQLHRDLDTIYDFLRRDLKLDNRKKFHTLMKTLLIHDNPANSIKIFAEYINKTDSVDEIKKSLDLFRVSDIQENEIEEFLRKVKYAGYTEYEDSFIGDHFDKKRTKLYLKYSLGEEYKNIYGLIEGVLLGKIGISEAVSRLYQSIMDLYDTYNVTKADLESKSDLYDEKNQKIIKKGDFLEVKKLDYQGDSYLSEFFAIYKYSKLPEKAFEPNFLKVYNSLIDGLFTILSTESSKILEDVKKSFAGIIYDNKIFISSEDIELYWSNRGRSSCLKDHRLSIRYRINKPRVIGYVYDGTSVLKTTELKVDLMEDKIFCPITQKPTKFNENTVFINGSLLFEGRKEDARAKYPEHSDEVFNFYVENDPSGNQKYLNWLLKNTNPSYKAVFDLQEYLIKLVKFFHEKQNMFNEKDINKHTGNTLESEVKVVKLKLQKKQQEKQVKKEKTVIYQDDRWYIVSPHTWESSCLYGYGTKWCISMDKNSSYWKSHSRGSTFAFIIDKTKPKEDPLHKVAFRVIGKNNKHELWNAADVNIINHSEGDDYLDSLPDGVVELIDKYHSQNFNYSWVDDDSRAQSILTYTNQDEIEDSGDYWYGMPVYYLPELGEHWCASEGDEEMQSALRDNYLSFTDAELLQFFDPNGDYLFIPDEKGFIEGEVEYSIDEYEDKELLLYSDLYGEWESLEQLINDPNTSGDKIRELIEKQGELIDRSKKIVADDYKSEWVRCLSNGVKECLIDEKGWFSSVLEIYFSTNFDYDSEGLIYYLITNSNYSEITPYGFDLSDDYQGKEYIVFKLDY
jgi:hypothetical protein